MNEQIHKILDAASSSADAAEVYQQKGQTRSVKFDNNRLKDAKSKQFNGVGLRVIKDGRVGFASTTDLRNPDQFVMMALDSAEFGDKARFQFPGTPEDAPSTALSDPATGDTSHRSLIDMGKAALNMSRQSSDEYLFSSNLTARRTTTKIINTSGLNHTSTTTLMSGSVEIQETTDEGILQAYEYKSWRNGFDELTDITQKALQKMRDGRSVVPLPTNTMPVIFTPKSANILFSPLTTALNGKIVQKGSSVLENRIGEEVIDPGISLIDDPSVDFAPGSSTTDDEGLPTCRRPLIRDGVLEAYYNDLQTAGLLDDSPTGNGYRSFSKQPSPSLSNLIIREGKTDYQDLLNDLDTALIVDQTLGSGQSNTLAGEFSVNVSLGLLVQEGTVKGRLKDIMIAGNVYDVLNDIEALCSDRQWVGSHLFPPVCITGVKIASQQ
ncbi:MAG: TldD/PmbA family protein [Candidatus Brocadiia bacterium]